MLDNLLSGTVLADLARLIRALEMAGEDKSDILATLKKVAAHPGFSDAAPVIIDLVPFIKETIGKNLSVAYIINNLMNRANPRTAVEAYGRRWFE